MMFILLLTSSSSFARGGHSGRSGSHSYSGSHSVRSHTTKRGTYVSSHRRTNGNHTKADNWSTKGNVNPYTGKAGTKNH